MTTTLEAPTTEQAATDIQRTHTFLSIASDTGASKRTVQRWHSKAVKERETDIGMIDGDTRYFSDTERDILTAYQSAKPKNQAAERVQPTDVIEGELIEPGAIELHTTTTQGTGLISFDLGAVTLETPAIDLSLLEAQTEQLQGNAQLGANAINAFFASRFDVGLAQIAAEQDNLLAGIRANALNGAAQSVAAAQKA